MKKKKNKRRLGVEPRELSPQEKAICLMNLAAYHGVAPQHIVDLYYHYVIVHKMDKKYIHDNFFGNLPITIKDLTPSIVRMAFDSQIVYWQKKVDTLNEKAGIDTWFVTHEGRDFGMTNRKPAQYFSWVYPKDKEYPNTLFGRHLNKVLRWMGADAWTFDETMASMRFYGISIPYALVKEQLAKGMRGEKVDHNLLEADDIEDLYSSKRIKF